MPKKLLHAQIETKAAIFSFTPHPLLLCLIKGLKERIFSQCHVKRLQQLKLIRTYRVQKKLKKLGCIVLLGLPEKLIAGVIKWFAGTLSNSRGFTKTKPHFKFHFICNIFACRIHSRCVSYYNRAVLITYNPFHCCAYQWV